MGYGATVAKGGACEEDPGAGHESTPIFWGGLIRGKQDSKSNNRDAKHSCLISSHNR